MSGAIGVSYGRKERGAAELETPLVRGVLIALALSFLALFLVAPLITVFGAAFSKGIDAYLTALAEPETWAAIQLTLITAGIAVPMNTIFGIAAAWVLSKYDFRGKSALLTLIDLPFSVSPVISGLIFVLLFGAQGLFAAQVQAYDVKVVFAVPGIVLATTFVTFPLVAREVLAVMEAQGSDEEEAALTLGANLWQIFFKVTLPKIRWGLFYGVILCNARAMGEFGAVSVVSGHIRGETNTMPLQVEILYNEYNFVAAFAVASLLTLLALLTLGVKKGAEFASSLRDARRAREAESEPTVTVIEPRGVTS
jgi:sulfate/thiosulfate transport system permease protein